MKIRTPRTLLACALALPAAALAQTALPAPPDAGRILQELSTPPAPPQREDSPLRIEPSVRPATPAGGATVTLRTVEFAGNTAIDAAALRAALGDFVGRTYDLAGLRALAERVAATYRERGYPFVRATLPAQEIADGTLRIEVLEGRWGRIEPAGERWMVDGARPFLAPLARGALIHAKPLERVVLLLEDQPGIHVVPVLRPGEGRGEGDLAVGVERDSRVSGQASLDNAGSRWSGEHRAQAVVGFDSPFAFGDRLLLRALVTDERLWLGGIDYERPLGGSGLRGLAGVARTHYTLGGPYRAIGANGVADVATLRLSYPIVRTQLANLSLSAALVHKSLEDRNDVVGEARDRSSRSLPLTLQFDRRDGLLGGGIVYGALSFTAGELRLGAAQRTLDATTARTEGAWRKLNLDAARIQRLPGPFALYGRYSAQWASRNLDSSESFVLGGIYGVRGYPPGEGLGSRGWLAQAELRWLAGAFTPYLFADVGRAQANVRPWDAASDVRRELGAAGFGLRWDTLRWSVDATLAWRTQGGPPTSDTRDRNPRLWVQAARRF